MCAVLAYIDSFVAGVDRFWAVAHATRAVSHVRLTAGIGEGPPVPGMRLWLVHYVSGQQHGLLHFATFEFESAYHSNQANLFARGDSSHDDHADKKFHLSYKSLHHATRKTAYTKQRVSKPCLRDRLLTLLASDFMMATDSIDPEKGLVSAKPRPAISSWASSAPGNAEHSPDHTPLQLFQLLVGIHTPSSLTQDRQAPGKSTDAKALRGRSDNIGLYQRAKEHERQSRMQYKSTSFISNTLFMVQILLAATITALSAYKKAHVVTLTVLGAANTVIAG